MELINVKRCEFCGKSEEDTRIIKSKFGTLCRKHYLQMYKHGEIKRTKYDPNEIIVHEDYAEIIAEGVPYLRVDFYVLDGNVYFGEATFFTWSGFLKFEPKDEDWDKKLGELLKLPEKKTI